ncbi:MAG: hypothetical protein AAGI72_08750 [Pseudomonadota bacterium]
MTPRAKVTAIACVSLSVVALLAAPFVEAEAEAASDSASGYQMTAVIDRARGKSVLAGDYESAIERLMGQRRKRFESSNNLCVAYAMTGDFDRADAACADALKLSEESRIRRDKAVALSNIGVLKALGGDLSGARADFSKALDLSGELSQASDNLSLLSSGDA